MHVVNQVRPRYRDRARIRVDDATGHAHDRVLDRRSGRVSTRILSIRLFRRRRMFSPAAGPDPGRGGGRIPNLLWFDGPAVVVDVGGEMVHVTARRRRELGQQVVILDPSRLSVKPSDRFNPLDLLTLPGSNLDTDAGALAEMIADRNSAQQTDFWMTPQPP